MNTDDVSNKDIIQNDVQFTSDQLKYINCKEEELLFSGSAGSGKTSCACWKCIIYALTYPCANIYMGHITMPYLRDTSMVTTEEILLENNIPFEKKIKDAEFHFENGSKIKFRSLDKPNKWRSINADMIYIEQAEQFRNEDFYHSDLLMRLGRGPACQKQEGYPQVILVVQPDTPDHWIYKHFYEFADCHGDKDRILEEEKKRKVCFFDYRNNFALLPQKRKSYEDLKFKNIELYRRFSLGEWGRLTNVVYTDWDTEVMNKGFDFYSFGGDFGATSPSCFLLCGFKGRDVYVLDEVYGVYSTNGAFMKACIDMVQDNGLYVNELYWGGMDAAEPDRIQEFSEAGFLADKSVKNIQAKISTVKQMKIHINPVCMNTLREIKAFVYQTNKDGVITDKPVLFNDHSMDALGYCVYCVAGANSIHRRVNLHEDITPSRTTNLYYYKIIHEGYAW